MSIWGDLWAEEGNGAAPDLSKLNILTVRPGATEVEGKVYPDIISAQDYAVTQTPSATNIFVIEGSKGFVNSENYVVKDWIQLKNFILDGEITTNIAPGGAFERGLIIDCICSNVSGTAAKILIFIACKITGGTAVAGSFIVPVQDSTILGGDFSLAAAFIAATSSISGGIFGSNAVAIRLSQVGSNAGSPTLSGGTITKSVIEMNLVIANTETIEMFDCTFEAQAKTITIESGGTLNCENLTGKSLIINIDAGGILNSWNISNRITVNNSGTWNNFPAIPTLITDSISADQTDYNPTGLSGADIIEISSTGTADYKLNSIVNPGVYKKIILINTNQLNALILPNSGAGALSNRFNTPNNADYEIPPYGSIEIHWLPNKSRWHIIDGIPKRLTISPAISSDQTDWAPTGIGSSKYIRIDNTAGGNVNINSIFRDSPIEGRDLILFNLDTVDTITIKHLGAGFASNQIICHGGADIVIPVNGRVDLWYDIIISKWRAK